jgi:hypothetical protein
VNFIRRFDDKTPSDLMRLKIRKTKSGTYYIPSLSIRELKRLAKKDRRRWELSKDGKNIYLDAE